MRLDRPQTFPTMAVTIGWAQPGFPDAADAAGRSLLRLCLRREDEIAKEFVIRDRRGQPCRVTLGAITRYLPELKPARIDLLTDGLRQVAEGLESKQRGFARDEIAKVFTGLRQRVAELESKFAALNLATVGQPKSRRRRRNRRFAGPRGTTPDHSKP